MTERTPAQWRAYLTDGPDTIDLGAAYLAECRVVLGEKRTAELLAKHGPEGPIFELAARGEGRAVHQQVARGTGKRLLAFYDEHPETVELPIGDPLSPEPNTLMAALADWGCDFRRDFDPSVMQFTWAVVAAKRAHGVDVDAPFPDAPLLQQMFP